MKYKHTLSFGLKKFSLQLEVETGAQRVTTGTYLMFFDEDAGCLSVAENEEVVVP